MEDPRYRPPSSSVADVSTPGLSEDCYVVSNRKYWMLMILTFGLYRVAWHYKHWVHYRDRTGDSVWPVPRAIFSVFFTHTLFSEIDAVAERAGVRRDWNPASWATLYVVAVILESGLNRVERFQSINLTLSLIASLALMGASAYAGSRAQAIANVGCGDPAGTSNAEFTVANWIWMVIGGIFWLLVIAGLMLDGAG